MSARRRMIFPFSIPPIMLRAVDFARNIPILCKQTDMNTPITELCLRRVLHLRSSILSIDSPSFLPSNLSYCSIFFSGWVGRWGRLRAEEAPNWLNGSPNNPRVLDSTTVAVRPNRCHWCWAYQLIQLKFDDIWSSINHIWLDILSLGIHWLLFICSTQYIQLPTGSLPSYTAGSTSQLSKDLAMPPQLENTPLVLCRLEIRNPLDNSAWPNSMFIVFFQ